MSNVVPPPPPGGAQLPPPAPPRGGASLPPPSVPRAPTKILKTVVVTRAAAHPPGVLYRNAFELWKPVITR